MESIRLPSWISLGQEEPARPARRVSSVRRRNAAGKPSSSSSSSRRQQPQQQQVQVPSQPSTSNRNKRRGSELVTVASHNADADAVSTYQVPLLLTLVRQGQWDNVLARCEAFPREAQPTEYYPHHHYYPNVNVGMSSSLSSSRPRRLSPTRPNNNKSPTTADTFDCFRRDTSTSTSEAPPTVRNNSHASSENNVALGQQLLYHETALGILCASLLENNKSRTTSGNPETTTSHHQKFLQAARALVVACPEQVRCSQLSPGHTPLRTVLLLLCNNKNNSNNNSNNSIMSSSSCCGLTTTTSSRPLTILESLVQLLLQTDKELDNTSHTLIPSAVSQKDSDGLYPIDHIVKSIQVGQEVQEQQQGPTPIPTSTSSSSSCVAMDLLQVYVATVVADKDEDNHGMTQEKKNHATDAIASPLVRLFSLGTSFGFLPTTTTTTRSNTNANVDWTRLERILLCTQRLLKWKPSLVVRCSRTTGCSPLHVALRNYGNYMPLIRELMMNGPSQHATTMLAHRNHYGDLPLHVACAVGVPLDVLRLVLARTLLATSTENHHPYHSYTASATVGAMSSNTIMPSSGVVAGGCAGSGGGGSRPHPLVWSRNASCYSAVDLEWIRHIEAGNGFFSHRSFYPLDTGGIRKPTGRDGELYDLLLRQAVNQVLNHHNEPETTKNIDNKSKGAAAAAATATTPVRVDLNSEANKAFGLLLHRIFLVIRAAFHDSFSRFPIDLSGDILHLAAALSGPVGPGLPRPILELIRWQYPEQLLRRDHLGRLPLHYCFEASRASSSQKNHCDNKGVLMMAMQSNDEKIINEWRLWVKDVIHHEPSACRVVDNFGRLPLHYALECIGSDSLSSTYRQGVIAEVIDDLLNAFPESVEAFDQASFTYPFMLAASNPYVSFDTVYSLVRRSPGVLAHCRGKCR